MRQHGRHIVVNTERVNAKIHGFRDVFRSLQRDASSCSTIAQMVGWALATLRARSNDVDQRRSKGASGAEMAALIKLFIRRPETALLDGDADIRHRLVRRHCSGDRHPRVRLRAAGRGHHTTSSTASRSRAAPAWSWRFGSSATCFRPEVSVLISREFPPARTSQRIELLTPEARQPASYEERREETRDLPLTSRGGNARRIEQLVREVRAIDVLSGRGASARRRYAGDAAERGDAELVGETPVADLPSACAGSRRRGK